MLAIFDSIITLLIKKIRELKLEYSLRDLENMTKLSKTVVAEFGQNNYTCEE